MIRKVFRTEGVGDTVCNRIPVTITQDKPLAPDFTDVIVNVGATGDMLIDDFMALAASVVYEVNDSYDTFYHFPDSNDLVDA